MLAPSTQGIERAMAVATTLAHRPDGPEYRETIAQLIGLENYRAFRHCPDMERLAAYSENRLPLDDALDVATHENQCPLCREEIAELRAFTRQQVTQILASAPDWTSPFVGREAASEALAQVFGSEEVRNLTLTAPSGTGKTRLTLETAMEHSYLFPDGVWYVQNPGGSAEAFATEVAHTVQMPLNARTAPLTQLQDFFAEKRGLLLLDHLTEPEGVATSVTQLLEAAPSLRCLTLGSASLEIPNAESLSLPPMEMPRRDEATARQLERESLRLFQGHVQTFLPDYAPDEAEARAAAGICTRTGGMPLAIELAAARLHTMSPQEVLQDLERRGPLAETPNGSLSELMEWTYGLLTRREQTFLQRLGVFVDGFFAEQAAVVCEEDEAEEFIERLHRLAIAQREERLGRARYRLLSPIQRFVRRQNSSPETVKRRHSAYFLQYAQERASLLETSRQIRAFRELAVDLPNLRAGMDSANEQGEETTTGRYGLALYWLLMLQGDWAECGWRLRTATDAFEQAEDLRGRTQAELALTRYLRFTGEFEEAERLLTELLERAQAQEEREGVAVAQQGLGNLALLRGRTEEAASLLTTALRYFEAAHHRLAAADCRQNLAYVSWQRGDSAEAERLFLASLATLRGIGDRHRLGKTVATLGNLTAEQGRWDEARRWFEEALALQQELGEARGSAVAIGNMGRVWQHLGDYARAEYCFADAIRRFEHIGDRAAWGETLALQGQLATLQGDAERARTCFQESLRVLATAGDESLLAQIRADLERVEAALRTP